MRVLRIAGRILATLVLFVAMLVLHLPTRGGRGAARDAVNHLVGPSLPGTLRIASIERLTPGELVVSGITFTDDDGHVLVENGWARAAPASRLVPAALGRAPFPAIQVRAGTLHARVPVFRARPGVQATPDRRAGPTRVFPAVTLRVDRVVNEMPTPVALGARGVHLAGSARFPPDQASVRLDTIAADLLVADLPPTRLAGHLSLEPTARVNGRLSLEGGVGRCFLGVETARDGLFTARVWDCAPPPSAVNTIAAQDLELRARIDELRVEGPVEGPWSLTLAASVNDAPLRVTARADGTRQVADITLDNLSLRQVRSNLPPTDLDGTIHLERHVLPGDAQRFVVNTTRLTAAVQGVPVPPLYVAAVLRGRRVTVESLRSDPIGLRGSGWYDLAGRDSDFHAEASLDTPDLARLPWTRGRARGALRLNATVEGDGPVITGTLTADARNLRVARARIATAHVSGRGRWANGRATVDVAARTSGLVVPGVVGPADVAVNVRGDPTRSLDVGFDARGPGLLAAVGATSPEAARGPTYARGRVRVGLGGGATRVDLAGVDVSLRGSRGHVTGSLALPQGGGRPQGTLRVTTDTGALAALDLGRHEVDLHLRRFELAWLTGVLDLPPSLAGIAEGDITVNPSDLARTHGRLRVENGRIDPLGRFRAGVAVDHQGQVLSVQASMEAQRGAVVELDLQAVVPRRRGDPDEWVRGVRGGHLVVRNVALPAFQDLLPGVGGFQGVLPSALRTHGVLDARVVLQRTPGSDLAVAFGLQGRGISAETPFGPVAVPLRVAAAGCTSLASASVDDLPVEVRVEVGVEDRSPRRPVEPRCSREAPLLPSTLAAAGASLRGPWLAAVGAMARDYARPHAAGVTGLTGETRRLLADAWGAVTVRLGPLRRAAWPLRRVPIGLSAERGVVFLTPPDVPHDTTVALTASATGPLLGLALDAEAEFRAGSVPQIGLTEPFVGRAVVRASPAEGETLLGPVRVDVNGLVELSPALPREQRGQIALDLIVRGDVASIRREGVGAVEVQRFDVDSENIALERFEWARDQGVRGLLAARVVATNDPARPVSAALHLTDLQARPTRGSGQTQATPPARVTVRGVVVDGEGGLAVKACAYATVAEPRAECDPEGPVGGVPGDGGLRFFGTVPLEGALREANVALGRATAAFRAQGFHLDALSPLVRSPSIAGVGGRLSGSLDWSGATPYAVTGGLSLADGRLALVTLGEPLRDIELRVAASGRALRIERLDAALGRGTVRARGDVALGGEHVAVLDLRGRLDELPAAQEGNTFGWLTGDAHVVLRVGARGAEGRVEVDGLRVLVQEEDRRALQPLSTDPSVFIYGRTDMRRGRGRGGRGGYPIDLAYRTNTPVWLRRTDFAVAIRGDGRVRIDEAGTALTGSIALASAQSWFEIFGKRFYFDRVTIGFDGGVQLNPAVDIAAHYDSPSAGRIGVAVSGRMREPEVSFTSERFPTASQSEILAMLVIGRRNAPAGASQGDLSNQASAAAGSLVTGLTMGFLSSQLRREFTFLPTIIAEPGEDPSRGRYGAGVTLTPRLYVQATYGAASAAGVGGVATSTGGQLATEFRILAEYVVTETLTLSGTGGTSGRWGAEFFWSP